MTSVSDTTPFPTRVVLSYRQLHEDMDATAWRPSDVQVRQVRRPNWHHRVQRVPEDRGLARRVRQWESRHAGFGETGDGEVRPGGGNPLNTVEPPQLGRQLVSLPLMWR